MLTVGYNTIYLMIQTYLCLFWTHHLYVLMNNFTLAIFCRILEGTVLSIDPFNQKSITISFIQTNLNYSWQIPSIQKTLLFLLIEILVPPKKYNQKKIFAKKNYQRVFWASQAQGVQSSYVGSRWSYKRYILCLI